MFASVRAAAAATVAVLFGMFLQPAEGGHLRGFFYTIQQGGVAVRGVIPLLGPDDVETFYGYPGGAARSATGLEQSDTSLLFLYEDKLGRVSLVMIHDANDGSGGKAVFDLAGIPIGTAFVVRDDPGDGSYAIAQPGGTARVTWMWNDINTDGGALSGSLEKQAWTISITPQFPAEGGASAGKITAWKFLTGSLDNPTAIGLDPTKPIVINAIPAGLQVVTTARLTAAGNNCQVATDKGPLTANLNVIVEGTLQVAGEQIIAPDGKGGLLHHLRRRDSCEQHADVHADRRWWNAAGHSCCASAGTFLRGGHRHSTGCHVQQSVPPSNCSALDSQFQIGGTTVSTGPWTLTAVDVTLLKVTISPDFPQIGWTAQIAAEAKPTLTFANVSGCTFVGTGQP